ncbi:MULTISPECIES: YrzQ family protein [Bacillus]|nr:MULTISPECIES: YrzQ family protein [Bacillus]QHZ47863.1 DUF3918 domain-containing protein [Bacillus sp. NSP9.1]WFA03944.1 YrzQ family protein [Bacillus sp. HSf4]
MNRTMTSLISLGAGALMYRMMSQNDMLNRRNMRKLRRRVMKMF